MSIHYNFSLYYLFTVPFLKKAVSFAVVGRISQDDLDKARLFRTFVICSPVGKHNRSGQSGRDREQLAACRAFLLGGGAQHLLVTELSRLGRSLKQVLEVVDDLTERGVNIYFQAQGLNTIVDGKPDATVKAMVSMFGAFAELERTTIVDRLQSGRRVALEKGSFTPGRPTGSKMSDEDLLAKYPKAVKRLKAGRTVREVAMECGLSTKTVQKVKNALK